MQETRELRLDLLSLYRGRGEILSRGMCTIGEAPTLYVAQQMHLSSHEVWEYIRLYQDWMQFRAAETWAYEHGRETPLTVHDALRLVDQWRAVRRH
jgi:hypothetical protein